MKSQTPWQTMPPSLIESGIERLSTGGRSVYLMFAVFAFILYAGTVLHGYNMDDELVTRGHRLTSKGFSAITEILTSPYYMDDMGYSYEYRPITHISFAIENQLFGETPKSGHFINVFLYSCTVIMVLATIRSLFPFAPFLFAFLTTLLFAVHPMHVEVVASIKNRDEILAMLFGLLSLYNAIRAVDNGKVSNWLAVPMFLVLSLLSKTSGVAFLFLVPACAFLRHLTHPLKLLSLLFSVLVPLGLYVAVSGQPPFWFMTAGLIISAPFLIVPFWVLVRKIDFAKFLGLVRPKGWPPEQPDGLITLERPNTSEIVTICAVIALTIIGLALQWTAVPIALTGVLFLSPYWTGRYSLGISATVISLAVLLSIYQPIVGAACLLLYHAFIVCTSIDKRQWKQGVSLALIAALPLIISDTHALVGVSGLDFVTQLMFSGFGPIFPVVVTYLFNGRKAIVRGVWIVGSIVLLIDFVQHLDPIQFFVVCGNLVCLAHFGFQRPHWLHRPQHIMSFLIMVCIVLAFAIPGFNSLALTQQKGTEVVEESASVSVAAYGPDAINAPPPQEDRPLSFVEFPMEMDANWSTRLGTSSVVLVHYLKMMFIPWPQAFYYGYDEVRVVDMRDLWAIASVVIHLLLGLFALVFARSHPALSFGILAYLAAIFLFSNLISPIAGMVGDRLTYVASFGFCTTLGYMLTWTYGKLPASTARNVIAAGVTLLFVTWSGMTVARSAKWKDALTLMRHDIQQVPNSSQAHNLLASHLMKNSFEPAHAHESRSMRMEAIGHYKQAVRIWPEFFNVWYDMGRVYMLLDDPASALPCFKETHRLDSTFFEATYNVAIIADKRGDQTTAIKYYERCIRFNPEMQEAYNDLSYLYFRLGRYQESIEVNERAIRYNPSWRDPYENIALTYQTMGNMDKAMEYKAKLNAPR